MAVPAIPVIISLIVSFFTRETVKFLALKVLFSTLLFVCLPIVLNHFIVYLLNQSLSQLQSINTDTSAVSNVFQFSGLGAFFAVNLRLPECFSVFITSVVIKYSFKLIPFFRL